MIDVFKQEDKLYDVICESNELLCVISRFGIGCGFGDKTIDKICSEKNIDINTFLAVLNFHAGTKQYYDPQEPLSLECLCDYLQNTHRYYLNFLLPSIRRKLLEALGVLANNDTALMILKFWDEYVLFLRRHTEHEEREVFPYVASLLQGGELRNVVMDMAGMHSSPMEKQLAELKSLVIKFYDGNANTDLLNSALHDIFVFEQDLMCHCKMETILFVEQLKRLERSTKNTKTKQSVSAKDKSVELSEREKDVINCVVKGMSNKEIAEKLFISLNTVTTHRKNIAKKTDIHSPAALTLYAIMNNIVSIEEIK
jgi:regulator of cell morphogenesis and NO signaling